MAASSRKSSPRKRFPVFDTAKFSPAIAQLLATPLMMELGPGSPNRAVRAALASLTPENAFSQLGDRSMAMACIAGLWLYHDFLDQSHTISQDLDNPTGSYWHGIMHRREPDPDNAKYWFRKVGPHPILSQLETEAPTLGYSYRNSLKFVDFCERVRGTDSKDELLARQVQLLEMHLLFDWCYNKAISG